MNRPFLIVLCVFLLVAESWGKDRICLVGSSIMDMEGGRWLENSVLIEGDRIEAVTGRAPDELLCDSIIDGSGKFTIPGLWDMHVHGTRRAHLWPIYVANGVTGIRDLFGPRDTRELRQQLAAAPIKPRVTLAGPIVDGPPGIWPGSMVVSTAEEARQAVSEQAQAGVDFIKVYQLLSRKAYFAIADEAANAGIPIAGHVPTVVTATEASEAGQVSIEHMADLAVSCAADEDTLRRNPPRSFLESRKQEVAAFRSFDRSKCRQLAQTFLRNGTWLVPTLAVSHAESRKVVGDATDLARLKYFDAETRSWLHPERRVREEDRVILRDALQVHLKLVNFFFQEGVPLLAGTDAMNPYTFPGFSLHDELSLLVDAGLTPLEALRTSTTNPARYLGRDDELGTVAAGKLADLVLLEVDPLIDIRNTSRIAGVIANGEYYDSDTLDAVVAPGRHH